MTSFGPRSFPVYPTPRMPSRVTYISIPMATKSPTSLPFLRLGCALLGVAACGHRNAARDASAVAPPRAEFLVATQDSTFWISTDGSKVRARGAPLILARYDGRFYELYVADDDRSFQGAMLVGLRLYRRDLQLGDSAVVFEDSIIPRIAREYLADRK